MDAKLMVALTSKPGYEMDPFFMCYVGYALEPFLGVPAPPFEDVPWLGQHTLIRLA
ncbi:hypothetical protein [Corallococcus sp. CA049B]|uniref:hypothetical protein n=1 Tax=Corallococcus sp. CA049B TaxID=2316730 RepID=UPI0013158ECA|nr:hypothetical protein [Corallococcus sp. CA049B]